MRVFAQAVTYKVLRVIEIDGKLTANVDQVIIPFLVGVMNYNRTKSDV